MEFYFAGLGSYLLVADGLAYRHATLEGQVFEDGRLQSVWTLFDWLVDHVLA